MTLQFPTPAFTAKACHSQSGRFALASPDCQLPGSWQLQTGRSGLTAPAWQLPVSWDWQLPALDWKVRTGSSRCQVQSGCWQLQLGLASSESDQLQTQIHVQLSEVSTGKSGLADLDCHLFPDISFRIPVSESGALVSASAASVPESVFLVSES